MTISAGEDVEKRKSYMLSMRMSPSEAMNRVSIEALHIIKDRTIT